MIARLFFQDGESRARIVIKIILGGLIPGICLILLGIYLLGAQIKTDRKERAKFETEAREDMGLRARQWQALQTHNPELAVPQVVEPETNGSGPVIVIPPKPSPDPTPKPQIKTRTVIRYKPKPTPWPWWKARPSPTPKSKTR